MNKDSCVLLEFIFFAVGGGDDYDGELAVIIQIRVNEYDNYYKGRWLHWVTAVLDHCSWSQHQHCLFPRSPPLQLKVNHLIEYKIL